jgi:hypothetical protein
MFREGTPCFNYSIGKAAGKEEETTDVTVNFVKSPVFKPRRKSLPDFVRFRFEQGFI